MENTETIYLAIALVSALFGVIMWVRKPQEKSEMNDAVFDEKMKAILDKFDTRFQDMKDGVVKVMQNDMQELKSDVREHVKNQIINERAVASDFTKIFTLLDERLPRK